MYKVKKFRKNSKAHKVDFDSCNRNATVVAVVTTAKAKLMQNLTHVAVRQRRLHLWSPHNLLLIKSTKIATNLFALFLILNMISHASQVSEAAAVTGRELKERDPFAEEICSTELSWADSCKGEWKVTSNQTVPHRNLNKLRHGISVSIIEVGANENATEFINIWNIHRKSYRGLPRIKHNSKLNLHAWHRKMQVYVAGFTYLRRAQLYYDYKKVGYETNFSRSVKSFERSALEVLCQIEETINATNARHKRQLRIRTREEILHNIQFKTIAREFHANNANCTQQVISDDNNPPIVNEIDLKFIKFRFMCSLCSMRTIIKQKIASRRGRDSSSSFSFSFSSSSSSSDSRHHSSQYSSSDINESSGSELTSHIHKNRLCRPCRNELRHSSSSNIERSSELQRETHKKPLRKHHKKH